MVCLLMGATATWAEVSIIPKPVSLTEGQGRFEFQEGTTIGFNDPSLEPAAGYLEEILRSVSSLRVNCRQGTGKVQLVLMGTGEGADESYTLETSKKGVRIASATYRGIVNGIATLRQLLPVEKGNGPLTVPAVSIKDEPVFHWRGLMLDPVRHFYSVEETKRLLDEMALYKLNKFHWHLSDNEGFRLELKTFPRLTEDKSAWRTWNYHDRKCLERAGKENNPALLIPWKFIRTIDGEERYGGFYTQEEVRDIVAYAAVRGIDIIPEIDMPGHTTACCQSYPWLSCTDDGRDPLCLGRNTTLRFAEILYDEVFKLFPYEYVSIGGDEVNRRRWSECEDCKQRIENEGLKDVSELQSWFTKRMEKFFNDNGRRILGWDEILEGGLSKTATVHWWRGDHPDVTQRATAMGNEVVLCPTTFLYFDYGQDDNTLRKIYDGDIVPTDLNQEQLKLVKGMQANIWGEQIPTEARMEWMVFPRALALAEKAWTPRGEQNWDDFLSRLQGHLPRLDAMGIQYRPLHTNRP